MVFFFANNTDFSEKAFSEEFQFEGSQVNPKQHLEGYQFDMVAERG